MTAIHWASMSGNNEILRFLLENKAKIFPDLYPPLLLAARYGRLECVSTLVDYGVDINCVDQAGRTPLHLATWFGHHEIVKLLLNKGAAVDQLDNLLRSALHFAAWFGSLPSLDAILEKSTAQLNAQDKSLNTPLHLACQNNRKEVASALLNKGANTKLKNLIGQTVLNIAEADDKPEILELLQQKEGENTKNQGLVVDKTMIHELKSMSKTVDELVSSQEKQLQEIKSLRESLETQGQVLMMLNTKHNEMKKQTEEINILASQITEKITELVPKKSRFTMTHITK